MMMEDDFFVCGVPRKEKTKYFKGPDEKEYKIRYETEENGNKAIRIESEDGTKTAFVINGKMEDFFDDADHIKFLGKSKYAYRIKSDGKVAYKVNKKIFGWFEYIENFHFLKNSHLFFVSENEQLACVINGTEYGPYEYVESIVFGQKGNWAFAALKECIPDYGQRGKWAIIKNSEEIFEINDAYISNLSFINSDGPARVNCRLDFNI